MSPVPLPSWCVSLPICLFCISNEQSREATNSGGTGTQIIKGAFSEVLPPCARVGIFRKMDLTPVTWMFRNIAHAMQESPDRSLGYQME